MPWSISVTSLKYTSRHGALHRAGLILTDHFPLSLFIFHNHSPLPVPICGYHPSLLHLGYLTLPFSPSLFPPSQPPPSFTLYPTPPIYDNNMPILLHYIQLYRLCYLRQRLWCNVRATSQRRAVSLAALFPAARSLTHIWHSASWLDSQDISMSYDLEIY